MEDGWMIWHWLDDGNSLFFLLSLSLSLSISITCFIFLQSLGQAGRVTKVFPTGDIRASVNGRTWTFNPACLTPAPGENPPAVPGQ